MVETHRNMTVNMPIPTIPQSLEKDAINNGYYLSIYAGKHIVVELSRVRTSTTKSISIEFAAFCLALVSTLIMRFTLNLHICVSSGIKMHKDMLDSILKSPIRFFDTNPVGELLPAEHLALKYSHANPY